MYVPDIKYTTQEMFLPKPMTKFTMRIMPKPGPEVIKLFSCSTQLSTTFQLLIKAKKPTNEDVSCFKSFR